MKNRRAFLTAALTVFSCSAFAARDLYVSSDKSYGSDQVPPEQLFDELQTAINAAATGDTVWVKDGFVCDSGIGGNSSRINVPDRRIAIRSQAGLVDEANALGATIKGPGSSCADADQARCVNFNGTTAKIIGFILEDGYPNANGGAVGGGASLLQNCVVRNSKGKRGGGVSGAVCEGCVITNNFATEMGGGVYYSKTLNSCTIACNQCEQYGGGVGTWAPQAGTIITNCLVYGNVSRQQGGGLAFRGVANTVQIFQCVISNNTCVGSFRFGGGVYSDLRLVELSDCDIVDNAVEDGQGGGLHGCVATKCRIVRNSLTSTGGTYTSGGGAYNCVLTNCVVSFNTNTCLVAGKMYSCGGGAFGGAAVGCRFEGNFANYSGGAVSADPKASNPIPFTLLSGCLITNNFAETGNGGGICNVSHAVGSVIVGNRNTSNHGGGVAYCELVENCDIIGNRGYSGGGIGFCTLVSSCRIADNYARNGGGAYGGTLVGCVLTNNATTYRGGGFYGSTLYNCRVVGNRVISGEAGGGWDGVCYNSLIADNQGIGFKCWDMVSSLFNCTITGNGGSGFTTMASDKLRAVNVISWGNGASDKATLVSSNCCLAAGSSVPAGSDNVFMADPRLTADLDGNLLPKNRRCRNAGMVFDWMTDPTDVRSCDLAGNDRIQGSAPDFGCFESKNGGLLLMFR